MALEIKSNITAIKTQRQLEKNSSGMQKSMEKLSSGFVFNNPNQTDACGCGESVTLTPAKSPN